MTSVTGDVRDLEHLGSVLAKHKPEIVIHMAAQSLVRYSYDFPVETYATNVMGTVNVHEAVRQAGCVKVVIAVTSDKCYQNQEWVWGYREHEPMGGNDPYSNSKGCAELVTHAYRSSFFKKAPSADHVVAVASARSGNVIGGGDWAEDRLVPDIIKAFMEGLPVPIRNPQAVRPWQHVLDPLNGYLMLGEQLWENGPSYSEAWNFGPNFEDAKPVSWIVDRLAEKWGKSAAWEHDTLDHPHEANYLRLDCSKARNRLDWAPKLSLETALDWIVEWYRCYAENSDVYELTVDQIHRHQELN